MGPGRLSWLPLLWDHVAWVVRLSWSPPLWDLNRLRYVGPGPLSWSPPLCGIFVASVGCLYCGILIASATWDLCHRSWSSPLWDLDHLCYVGPLLPQLVTSAMGSWSPPLRGIFVAPVGRFRYVRPLLPQLVASAIWDLSRLCSMWDLGCRRATWDLFLSWHYPTLPKAWDSEVLCVLEPRAWTILNHHLP